MIEKYRLMWGTSPDFPLMPVDPEAAAAKRRPLDENRLTDLLEQAKDNVEMLMHRAHIRVGEYVSSEYLDALQMYIVNLWPHLNERAVFEMGLTVIEKMHDDPVAAYLGYEYYKLWDPLESTCRHASLSIL